MIHRGGAHNGGVYLRGCSREPVCFFRYFFTLDCAYIIIRIIVIPSSILYNAHVPPLPPQCINPFGD